MKPLITTFTLWLTLLFIFERGHTCKIGSEQLKSYTSSAIESLLRGKYLETVYWPNEPLDHNLISKATGLSITLAETSFKLDGSQNGGKTAVDNNDLVRDIFVACSIDRDRTHALTINLELDNPFKIIDINYEIPVAAIKRETYNTIQVINHNNSSIEVQSVRGDEKRQGRFRIRMPQSTFLVQLTQLGGYDECIVINYVQLEPSVNYEIECIDCEANEQKYLDNVFSKRMTQFDAELDSLLSEKFLLGLQLVLDQQRIDLELFMEYQT